MIAFALRHIQLIAGLIALLGIGVSIATCSYQRDRANELRVKLDITKKTLDTQTDTIVETLDRISEQENRGVEAVERVNNFLLEQAILKQQNDLAAEAQERKDREAGKNKTFDSRFIR